jgi:Ulp1 family protease
MLKRFRMYITAWLHDSMESEGKELKSKDWCLYTTRSLARGQPRQTNGFDCGLFTILFSLCIAKDLPLSIVQQDNMERGCCQLWHHLTGLLNKSK